MTATTEKERTARKTTASPGDTFMERLGVVEEFAHLTQTAETVRDLLTSASEDLVTAETLVKALGKTKYGWMAEFVSEDEIEATEKAHDELEEEMRHVDQWDVNRAAQAARVLYEVLDSRWAEQRHAMIKTYGRRPGEADDEGDTDDA